MYFKNQDKINFAREEFQQGKQSHTQKVTLYAISNNHLSGLPIIDDDELGVEDAPKEALYF